MALTSRARRIIIVGCLLLSSLGGIAYFSIKLASVLGREWVGGSCVVYGARLVAVEHDTCDRRRRLTAVDAAATSPYQLLPATAEQSSEFDLPTPPLRRRRRLSSSRRRSCHTHKETFHQPTFSVRVLGLNGPRVDACEHPSCSSGEQDDKDDAGRIVDATLGGACSKVGYAEDDIGAWLTMQGGAEGLVCDPKLIADPDGPGGSWAAPLPLPPLGERYCACSPTCVTLVLCQLPTRLLSSYPTEIELLFLHGMLINCARLVVQIPVLVRQKRPYPGKDDPEK
jgi:hypothetical protein